MTSLAELFAASGAPPQLQALLLFARKLDDIEAKLALLRPQAGFDESWLPLNRRKDTTPKGSPVTWLEKCHACNGQGDVNRYMGELADGMDVAMAKLEEMEGKFAPPPPPEEPKLTRAEWEAQMVTSSGGLPAAEKRGPGRPRRDAA